MRNSLCFSTEDSKLGGMGCTIGVIEEDSSDIFFWT